MEILFDVTQDTWPTGGEQDGDLKPQSREQGIQGLSWLALTDGRSESFERSTEDQCRVSIFSLLSKWMS